VVLFSILAQVFWSGNPLAEARRETRLLHGHSNGVPCGGFSIGQGSRQIKSNHTLKT
jgi:hypothetical protein